MKRTYTIKTYFENGLINQHLYQGRRAQKQKELPIRCRKALDKRIDYVMREQIEKLRKNPDLSPLIETIKIETNL